MDPLLFTKSHFLFKRLREREHYSLIKWADILLVKEKGRILFPDEVGEDFYMVISGELKCDGRRYKQGEYIGLKELLLPGREQISETGLFALKESKLLKLSRKAFIRFLQENRGCWKRLSPLLDSNERTLSGIPLELWDEYLLKTLSKRSRKGVSVVEKKVRTSFKLMFLNTILAAAISRASWVFIHEQKLSILITSLAVLFLIIKFIGWRSSLYSISEKAISFRKIDYRNIRLTHQRVPIEQIQSLEVQRNNLISRIFNVGNLIVKNSADEGSIKFRFVDNPIKLEKMILHFKEDKASFEKKKNLSEMRREILQRYGKAIEMEIIDKSALDSIDLYEKHLVKIFRKSRVVLFLKTWWQAAGITLFALLPRLIPMFKDYSFVMIVPIAALGFLLLWRFLDWKNDLYKVDGGYLYDIDRKPFGQSESRKQIELSNAQNIVAEQDGFLPILFNWGNVHVITPGGASDVVFEQVNGPWRVQNDLFQLREEWMQLQDQNELNKIREQAMMIAEATLEILADEKSDISSK